MKDRSANEALVEPVKKSHEVTGIVRIRGDGSLEFDAGHTPPK